MDRDVNYTSVILVKVEGDLTDMSVEAITSFARHHGFEREDVTRQVTLFMAFTATEGADPAALLESFEAAVREHTDAATTVLVLGHG